MAHPLQVAQVRGTTLQPPPEGGPSEGGVPGQVPRPTLHPPLLPLRGHRLRRRPAMGKSRRSTAYPQQIVTTRLLYCLQDRFAQLSRLQRI
jgi:hypothetical protein